MMGGTLHLQTTKKMRKVIDWFKLIRKDHKFNQYIHRRNVPDNDRGLQDCLPAFIS